MKLEKNKKQQKKKLKNKKLAETEKLAKTTDAPADAIKKKKTKSAPLVGLIMGSESDWKVMADAAALLSDFGVAFEAAVVSAHRTPDLLAEYASSARRRGLAVIIAGAGGAAHLPGMVAAFTELPVIGVPVPVGPLQGEDALLSIVQMPRGVPVATVAIGGAFNAGLLAVQILGASGAPKLLDQVRRFKDELAASVKQKKLPG